MASIHDILRPVVITKVVSQIAASTGWINQFFGMQPGGANERTVGGRNAYFDVYNNVRTVASGRAPGAPAGTRSRNAVGRTPFTFPRAHEKVFLPGEEINNIAKLGEAAIRDQAGEDYIRRQAIPPAQRLANWRTAMLVGMLKDSLYVQQDGDDLYVSFSSASSMFRINYGMPSGNQNQLNMLGSGNIIDASWDNPGANIPLHLANINSAFQQLYGGRLAHVMCSSNVWHNITMNDFVAASHGIANPPFEQYDYQVGMGPDGRPINERRGRLNCYPGVTFHISDDGLELGAPGSESWTKFFGTTDAAFLPEPTSDNFEMLVGSEPIADYDNAPMVERYGIYSWTKTSSNPTGIEMFTLDNALPVNYIPKSTAYGTVIF